MEAKELTVLKAVEKVHQVSKDSMLVLERYEAVKSEIGPANHTPVRPKYLGKMISIGIKTITCLSKLKTWILELFPLLENNLSLQFENLLAEALLKIFSFLYSVLHTIFDDHFPLQGKKQCSDIRKIPAETCPT